MDGITGSPTLGGVVLATLSAAGYAVFKVNAYFYLHQYWFVYSFSAPIFLSKTGNVSKNYGRSTGSFGCIYIYHVGFYQCYSMLAHLFGLIFDWRWNNALGKFIMDCIINCMCFNVKWVFLKTCYKNKIFEKKKNRIRIISPYNFSFLSFCFFLFCHRYF